MAATLAIHPGCRHTCRARTSFTTPPARARLAAGPCVLGEDVRLARRFGCIVPRKPTVSCEVKLSAYPILSGVPSCQFTALLISLDGRPSDQIQPIVGEQECRARLLIGNFLADPFNVEDANAVR